MKKIKQIGGLLILIVIIALIAFVWWNTQKPDVVYDSDTTVAGNLEIPAGEKHLLKNNATLNVGGDLSINGKLDCKDGAISIITGGKLLVNGELRCERPEELASEDLSYGINIVAKGDVEFTSKAVVVTNGHIQLVDDESKIAKSQEQIDKIFNDTGEDSGEGPRVGPFIPIEIAPGQEVLLPSTINNQSQSITKTNDNNFVIKKIVEALVPAASAQDPEQARDIEGNAVRRTVKIGGKWVVGTPNLPPPFNINIPTPPKGIKKIIIAYDFGPDADVNIADLSLAGPDGRPGTSDEGASCNAKGGKGEDAFRLNVKANNITVNNFTLRMGNGGDGGSAVSQINCDPGVAVGGEGGEPGNIKMQSTGTFKIEGQFKIIPGLGGLGGEAIAAGKTGEDGCPGEKGGEAKATGGKGGDNKKGLKTVNVQGLSNVVITELLAGKGGDAYAHGGDGGNGTGPACDGGAGGKATAVGGQGGTATSRTVPSTGGDGGNAEAYPGQGGDGGKGTAKDAGGNGGNGGDAVAQGGKHGTGRTGNGADGQALAESGGNAGNGGDGCPEGKGGKGGQGKPQGADGADGKNICPAANTNTAVKVGDDINTNTNTDTNGGATASDDTNLGPIEIIPTELVQMHLIGETSCPQSIGSVTVKLPKPGTILVTPPGWIAPPSVPATGTEIIKMNLQFY